ncbi:MAG: hypothetical protein ACD_7C00076G0001 [uncultured bacterium]|nr:MAG: hypothetical protein ACD_7C00076G0001 [uncultured bacterium]HBR78956.1 hypothetical protein [Candidatus Moranbacteria bacterium]
MCGQNKPLASIGISVVKKLDVPICPDCHFNEKVVKNTVKETIAAQKMELYGWKTPEWICCGCGHTF